MQSTNPTTVTDLNKREITNKNAGQGLVISSDGQEILTIGFGKDQSIGFSFRDGSNERIFIGKDTDGNTVFKFSQAGFDAKTADDDDLVMSSTFNLFKIVQTGTTSFASPNSSGSSTNVSITHSLGINPTVFAFVSFSPSGTAFPMPYTEPDLTGTPGLIAAQIGYECVGGDTITFFQRDLSKANNWTNYIRYYIVRETAAYS